MPTIRENLLKLRELVAAQPDPLFNLSCFQQPAECGTQFCTAGLAAQSPHFQAQGMHWGRAFFSQYPVVQINGDDIADLDALNDMFGAYAFDNLFSADWSWDAGEHDFMLDTNKTDKDLALRRIDKQLELYPH